MLALLEYFCGVVTRLIIALVVACTVCVNVAIAAPSPKIEIEGGTKALKENIRSFLSINDEACDAPLWRLRAGLRDAQKSIYEAGQALGYYRLDYQADIRHEKDCWILDLKIKPGEPVRVRELRIVVNGEGVDDPYYQHIYDNPGIKLGERLDHGKYEALKGRFGAIAAARGYFDGRFDLARVSVTLVDNAAKVELVYDSGKRYRFGDIRLSQDILDDQFVRRYINIREGDYYDTEKLVTLKNMYNASNYFSLAMATPDLTALNNKTVPIKIQLDARKRHSYSVGAGVATDTGPRLLLGYEDRYFTPTGHSIMANLHLASVLSTFEAAYKIPMKRPAYEYLKFMVGAQHEVTTSTESDLYRIGTSYTQFHDNQWLQTLGLNYERESSMAGSEERKETDLIIPSIQFSRTKADGRAYPLSGWRLMGELSGSADQLGSDFSFLQFHGNAKYIFSALGGRVILRSEIGLTEVGEFSSLPVSVRFFAGGDASVRGYSYKSIGSKDANGEVIGGSNLLVTSIEYDHLIKPQWAIAAFYDQGAATDDMNFNFMRSVGTGIRWISPIGPVRFDVACALDGVRCSLNSQDGWGLHLSIGPDL